MANIRVLARAIGGIALSISVVSVTASVVVQEYRIKQVAQPATIPIISNIFPVPLTPMLPESVFTSLQVAIEYGKPNVNLVDATEVVLLNVEKQIVDNITILENSVVDFSKLLVDSTNVVETPSIVFSTSAIDNLFVSELSSINVSKPFNNSVLIADTPAFSVGFGRFFDDSVNVVESISAFGANTGVEVVATTDFFVNIETTKPFSDTAIVSELIDITFFGIKGTVNGVEINGLMFNESTQEL